MVVIICKIEQGEYICYKIDEEEEKEYSSPVEASSSGRHIRRKKSGTGSNVLVC